MNLGHTEQASHFGNVGWRWEVGDRFNLHRVSIETFTREHITKELEAVTVEGETFLSEALKGFS